MAVGSTLPFQGHDRGAGRFYADDKIPTVPAVDPEWTAMDKQELASRKPSRKQTLSPASLPPYGRHSPVQGSQHASEGVGGRSWPVDDAYSKTTPVPPSPALSGYRDRDYARSPNLYSDVAPPAFESRPGTARPPEKIDLSLPIPQDAGMRSPVFRPGTNPPQEIEMRSPALRPGTAPLGISGLPYSGAASKPPTPRLSPRPGTAAPRIGNDSRPPLTVIGRSVELEGSPATLATGDGQPRLHSARRAPTPRFGRTGSPTSQYSGSVSSQGSTRSQYARTRAVDPRQVQTRVSPPPALSTSPANDDDDENNNHHYLASERHRPTPLDFTALNEPRRAATVEPRAPHYDGSSYDASLGGGSDVGRTQSPWPPSSPMLRPGTAAPRAGSSSPGTSRREWPRSPSRFDWRHQQHQQQQGHPANGAEEENVPLALRPGYTQAGYPQPI